MPQSGNSYLLKTPTDAIKAFQATPPDKTDFSQIGGLKTNTDSPTVQLIETTNKSSNENQTFLEGKGVLRLNISGSGVLQKDLLTSEIYNSFLQKKARWILIEREDGFITIAKCLFSNFNRTGSHDDALMFDFSLESSGTIHTENALGVKWNSGTQKFSNFQSTLNPFKYQTKFSPSYDLGSIPAVKQTAFDTALKADTIDDSDMQDGNPTTAITFTGNVANKYVFPIILLLKSELANKRLQLLDVLDNVIEPHLIGDFDDDAGNELRAFYIDEPLGNTEEIDIKVQIWN